MSTIAQIQALLNSLPADQKARVMSELNLKLFNVMTLSEQDAKALLLRLQAIVATMSNPRKDSYEEYVNGLNEEKEKISNIWHEARNAYSQHMSQLYGDNDTAENRQLAEILFSDMQLKGKRAVDATRRANNAAILNMAIQNISFNA